MIDNKIVLLIQLILLLIIELITLQIQHHFQMVLFLLILIQQCHNHYSMKIDV